MAPTERLMSGPPTLVATVHGADGRAVVQKPLTLTVDGTLILVSLLRPVVVSSASRTTGPPFLGNLRVETRWHCCSRSFPHCHLSFRLAAPPSSHFVSGSRRTDLGSRLCFSLFSDRSAMARGLEPSSPIRIRCSRQPFRRRLCCEVPRPFWSRAATTEMGFGL